MGPRSDCDVPIDVVVYGWMDRPGGRSVSQSERERERSIGGLDRTTRIGGCDQMKKMRNVIVHNRSR